MANSIGIRREDKNPWERRVPLTPSHVGRLIADHGIKVYVQPSTQRAFPDKAFVEAGAVVQEDLSPCNIIVGIKEIPLIQFQQGKTYLFFSHTIKGQAYNMPMLQSMMEKKCQLVDYERIVDGQGRRLVLFGRHAGLSGMIESLFALGKRLRAEGTEDTRNPFLELRQPYQYKDLEDAREDLRRVGERIAREGLPESITPLVVGFLGYGNVSKGAQEILDCLPVRELPPEDLFTLRDGAPSDKLVYKTVFKEEDTVEPADRSAVFSLDHYYKHPEMYRAAFSRFLPHLTVLVNGVYWDERYPVLVTNEAVKDLYATGKSPALRVIGDITCDMEGSIAMTRKSTLPDSPCYVYDTVTDSIQDGFENLRGPIIMAVEILPTEFPIESSLHFGDSLSPFMPALAAADFEGGYDACQLPEPIKTAVILYQGELTQPYRYLEKFVR